MEKIIGILGGMGPEATADLFFRIIRSTPAKRDQDHIRTLINSNPKIPDRTSSILHDGPSPLPEMVESGRVLERAGADFLVIPCNTAHYYLEDLQRHLKIPVFNMIKIAASEAFKTPKINIAGLLATDGTVKSGIYHQYFTEKGIDIISPKTLNQERVMKAIYDYIKIGRLTDGKKVIQGVAENLVKRGADLIICGCTEISLILHQGDLDVPVLDPVQLLAENAVAFAVNKKNDEIN
jgi:aspartate racemase